MTDLNQINDDFRQQGFCLIEHFLTTEELANLQQITDTLLNESPNDGGGKFHQIGKGNAKRFLRQRHESFALLTEFLFSEKVKTLGTKILNGQPYLFNEQFVVKEPSDGNVSASSFAWHQDGAYVGFEHNPYFTIWIALDAATTENGCVYVLPKNLNLDQSLAEHTFLADGKEKQGYAGEDPGIAIECKAGSALVFSSVTLHRSGANYTDASRRAYLCQYSSPAIVDPVTKQAKHFAKPL